MIILSYDIWERKKQFHSFIVEINYNKEQLEFVLDNILEDCRNENEDYNINNPISQLNAILNPLNFEFDRLLIEAYCEAKMMGYERLNEYLKNETSIYNDTLFEKLSLVKNLKNIDAFSTYAKKLYDYDPDKDFSNPDILKQKTNFCNYFRDLPIFFLGTLHGIDKIIFHYYFEKKLDEYYFETKNNFYDLKIQQMQSELLTIKNAILLNHNSSKENNAISITIRDGRENKDIISAKSIRHIIDEINSNADKILLAYEYVFNISRYNFLAMRESKKSTDKFEEIKFAFTDYKSKLKILKKYIENKLRNYKNGIFRDNEQNLAIRIDSFFKDHGFSSLQLDFLIIEIQQFVHAQVNNKTDSIYYLDKRYHFTYQLAKARQDELDNKKLAWVN